MNLHPPATPKNRGFASDNYAGLCPEAMEALQRANEGHAIAYGEDEWTGRAISLIQEIFERDCAVFFTFNGTAANALALAHLCGSYESILCHTQAHIEVDECGAPGFFSGGARQILVQGAHGKLDPTELEAKILERSDVHAQPPRVISLAQVTECGTLYTPAELQQIQKLCQKHQLAFHMDGARFANAVAALKVKPAELSWKVGVDVLSLGFTKNGVAMGEMVIFFDREKSSGFEYRCKQAGQLASKSRFIAAPMIGLLENDVWLRNASQANTIAAELESRLLSISGITLIHPRQANALFLEMPAEVAGQLHQKGWRFYRFVTSGYRLMAAWDNTHQDVERFISDLKTLMKGV